MLLLGIILGLAAASSQSISYLCSRWYTAHRGGGMIRLLVLGHVLQGIVCLPIVWLLWPANLPPVRAFLLPLLGEAGAYMLGQLGLFTALRYADASRVSPLLGIKIAILAVLTVTLLGDALSPLRWAAVAVAVIAAFALNHTGGRIAWRATAAIIFACGGYSMSDFCIRLMIEAMSPVDPLHAGLFAAALSYTLCGGTFAVLLPWYGSRRANEWAAAAPYAAAWLTAMFFLFACFALVGIVLGNILQSTRGLISILLGAGVSRRGLTRLEAHITPKVLYRRVAAATLMTAAIAMYVLGG